MLYDIVPPAPTRHYRDLKGQRFGLLTAVEFIGYRRNGGNAVWRCICDCGGEKAIRADRLTCGETRSCGCMRHYLQLQTMNEMAKKERNLNNAHTPSATDRSATNA